MGRCRRLREAFEELDLDGSGFISLAELQGSWLHLAHSDADLAAFIKARCLFARTRARFPPDSRRHPVPGGSVSEAVVRRYPRRTMGGRRGRWTG
jgi:hypothetical protein